jgi:hypothetical protein
MYKNYHSTIYYIVTRKNHYYSKESLLMSSMDGGGVKDDRGDCCEDFGNWDVDCEFINNVASIAFALPSTEEINASPNSTSPL